MWDYEPIKEDLKERMSPALYTHSLMVAQTAKELAEHYHEDMEKAYFAGLMHDYAKELSGDVLIQIAFEQELLSNAVEKKAPDLLHASVGAFLIQQLYKIMDPEIIQAISYHTLGGLDMTSLSKIVYLADKIEPGRHFPDLRHLHSLAYQNLDEAVLYSLESTIINCIVKKRILHPRTNMVRNHYLDVLIQR